MFQRLKHLFTKKQKIEARDLLNGKVIKFKDSYGQNSEIYIEVDGNGTVLIIKETKNSYKLAFDKETALILICILNSYYKTENLNDLINIFEKDEEN